TTRQWGTGRRGAQCARARTHEQADPRTDDRDPRGQRRRPSRAARLHPCTVRPRQIRLIASMTLSPSILGKLSDLVDRQEELAALLADPGVVGDRDKFTALSKEYAELEPITERHKELADLQSQIDDAQALLDDDDAELRELAADDREQLRTRVDAVE